MIPGRKTLYLILIIVHSLNESNAGVEIFCPHQEIIAPCKCSQRSAEIQVWCSHSDLPRVLHGLKFLSKTVLHPIDELILENNQLPSLPGRFLSPLNVVRLMLRHNGLERLASGWLHGLENSLVEIFIVERDLRSVPIDTLRGMKKLQAVTIQSDLLKRIPDFSGLRNLHYINIESHSLLDVFPNSLTGLPNLETIQITGSDKFNRLEHEQFQNLQKLKSLNLARNGINWIHLRSLTWLPNLIVLELSDNKITDANMIGRAIKDLAKLEILKLNGNLLKTVKEGSFVELESLRELYLNDNMITEIHHGAFYRIPNLKVVHLENNLINRVHPESFLQSSGSGVEIMNLQNNQIDRVEEIRSLLDTLPMLRFLDLSQNRLNNIPFGILRGHATLEQLYLDDNLLTNIDRDAFMAMPALTELRLRNNSLTDTLEMPFWNLPGLKGLDLSTNKFQRIDPVLFIGLPSLRRLDISDNFLSNIDSAAFKNTLLLETLNISRNELENIHPLTFNQLEHLFEIDISYNNLDEFIQGLPKIIERISLQKNKLTSISFNNILSSNNKRDHIVYIQQSLRIPLDLPNLRMLNLGANLIQKLPGLDFKLLPQLRYLNLAQNRLHTLDEISLHGLERLEILNLQDNRLLAMHEYSLKPLKNLLELNIQGNRLELLNENLFEDLLNLERLDASRNNLFDISPGTFRTSRLLRSIDLSNNNLKELPHSLTGLETLKDLDISFNNLANLSPEILSSWPTLEELKASNNKVSNLPHGTFRNLPLLQYLDLSSNELITIQGGAIKNLPELQELVLADNRLLEIIDRSFEELPNLQAVHLQQNNLQHISPHSFYRTPSIVYLNLSMNHFRSLDHIGLRATRNLEVLDLSNNNLRKINTHPLKDLDWLVELKLDDNLICKVQGEPFASMSRLRVLTMRNNRMISVNEPSFRSLRSNLAIFDLNGNPLDCTCNLLWLRGWLQESDTIINDPGPTCRDGTMLREARLTRQDCQIQNSEPLFDNINIAQETNYLPLTNEHGDIFSRSGNADECDTETTLDNYHSPVPPSDSEYFYDQYIDMPPLDRNLTDDLINTNNSSNKVLNHNKIRPPINLSPTFTGGSPSFTFFGLPLPSLNVGNLWNNNRNAKIESGAQDNIRNNRGKGRVQIYRPEDPELYKFVDRNIGETINNKNNNINKIVGIGDVFNLTGIESESDLYNTKYRPHFQTSFIQPQEIENGGFIPILPGDIGGFQPIQISYKNSTKSTLSTNRNKQDNIFNNELDAFGNLHNVKSNKSSVSDGRTIINTTTISSNWVDNFHELVSLITESTTMKQLDQFNNIKRSTYINELFATTTNNDNIKKNLMINGETSTTAPIPKTTESSKNKNIIVENIDSNISTNPFKLKYPENNISPIIPAINENSTSTSTNSIVIPKNTFQNNKTSIYKESHKKDNLTHVASDRKIFMNQWDKSVDSILKTTPLVTDSSNNLNHYIHKTHNENMSINGLTLIAPNAQPGTYRTNPIHSQQNESITSFPSRRSSITKVYSTSSIAPIAEEYLRTTNSQENLSHNIYKQNTVPIDNQNSNFLEDISLLLELPKKNNMDWYYENYNKTKFNSTIDHLRGCVCNPQISYIILVISTIIVLLL